MPIQFRGRCGGLREHCGVAEQEAELAAVEHLATSLSRAPAISNGVLDRANPASAKEQRQDHNDPGDNLG
jgi:hypothetical protein